MSYDDKYYIVYHNEVRYVDPREHQDGKVRIPLPPKVNLRPIFAEPPDKIEYNDVKEKMRFAVRRIRHFAIGGYYPGDIKELIEHHERIDRRRRLHNAEKEMKEAGEALAKAISVRCRFEEDLKNGVYADGQLRTELAIKKDRRTSQTLSAARNRVIRAAHELYGLLVMYGTITEEEAHRRMGVAMAWGLDVS